MNARSSILLEKHTWPIRCKKHAHQLQPLRPHSAWPGKTYRKGRRVLQARLGEDDRHVLCSPRVSDDGQQLSSVLLMLLPGAYMKCDAYDGLLGRLKVSCGQDDFLR